MKLNLRRGDSPLLFRDDLPSGGPVIAWGKDARGENEVVYGDDGDDLAKGGPDEEEKKEAAFRILIRRGNRGLPRGF